MMKNCLSIAMLTACLVRQTLVPAETVARDHAIVPEDYFTIAVITGCAISPDGSRIAYTDMRWQPPEEKRNTDLWVVPTQTRRPVRLTFDPAADTNPKWSADGTWIYFTSARERPGDDKPPYNGKKQIWRVRADGAAPMPVTRVEDGVGTYDLSHDGQTLYYTVSDKHYEEDDWKPLRKEFDELTYGHGVVEASQIWKLDLNTWRSEKIVDEKRVIREFAVAPGQQRIAMLTTPTEKLISNEGWSRVDVYDRQTGKVTTLPDKLWREDAPSPYGWLMGPAWSGDGRSLAFRIDFDGYPGEIFVAHLADGKDVRIQKLTRPNEVSLSGRHLEWLPGTNDLCFMAEDHARERVYCIRDIRDGRQGPAVTLTPGDVCVDAFSLSRTADRLAVVMSDVTHPPDLFLLPATGDNPQYERVTRVNPQVDTWKLPSIRIVQWKSPDGTDVEGILELPPDHTHGTPLPLMVEIHGGPTAATKLRLRFWIYGRTLMAARGWALFSPNYRGSTGYGDKFLIDLVGHKNDRDVQDILAGVDAMIERGIADPDRLAVMGWSNGGYLTNCLITRTDRFKAASSGAGVLDLAMQWCTEDTPGHVINYQQGFPWTRPDAMKTASALYAVDKVRTPTLIHVGEKDPRCPPGHSKGLYRALHQYLGVPCELIVYPDEPHGLTRHTHRKAKMEWDLKWFDHWVLGKPSDEKDADSQAGGK